MRLIPRLAGWALFLTFLIGLAYGLHLWFPPEPRCVIAGNVGYLLPDGAGWVSEVEPVWNVKAGAEITGLRILDTRTGGVRREYFPGSRFVLVDHDTDMSILAFQSADGWLRIVDLEAERTWEWKFAAGPLDRSHRHGIAFHAERRLLSIGISTDAGVLLVDMSRQEPIHIPATEVVEAWFSRDGDRLLLWTGNTLGAWNVDGGRLDMKLANINHPLVRAPRGQVMVAFSKEERKLVVWDLDRLERRGVLETAPVQQFDCHLDYSPDGRYLLVANRVPRSDDPAKYHHEVWDVDTLTRQCAFEGGTVMARFSPDGRALACGSVQGGFQVREMPGGAVRWSADAVGYWFTGDCWFSPDGASVYWDPAFDWRVADKLKVDMFDVKTGSLRGRIDYRERKAILALPQRRPRSSWNDFKACTGDGRRVTFIEEWLEALFPRMMQDRDDAAEVAVFDDSCERVYRESRRDVQGGFVSKDLTTLALTCRNADENYWIEFHDLPQRLRYELVLGVPGVLGLAGWCLLRWRRRRPAASSAGPVENRPHVAPTT